MYSWKLFGLSLLAVGLLTSGCGPSYLSEDSAQSEEVVEDEGDQDDKGGG